MTAVDQVIRPDSSTSPRKRAIIIGGGLAGMAAAVALQSVGIHVTLIESRSTLGGRAGSFTDPQTGETLDNCQHVLLGCCTNLIDFYKRTGALDKISWEPTVHFLDEHGKRHDLWGVRRFPAPLNLGPALCAFTALSLKERYALTRAMVAMSRLGFEGRQKLADVPFGVWLDEHRQPQSLVTRFYDPIIISGLNEATRQSSAAYAIQIFQDAMLANAHGYVVGMPNCPLGELYGNLPCADLRLSTRVAGIRFEGQAVSGVEVAGGEILHADAFVLATNHPNADRLIPEDLAQTDERFAHLDKLESVPILGAHLWFDRPILSTSHVAFMQGPLQWLFRKDADGKSLHGVISAARDWVNRPKEECLALFEQQVRQTIPAAREAKLIRGVVVVEKRATFSPKPGVDDFRPLQAAGANGITNLYLAGDYTRTGWPATMEGAVRSGYLAANAVAAGLKLDLCGSFLVPDLRSEWPARLMGLVRPSGRRRDSSARSSIAESAGAP